MHRTENPPHVLLIEDNPVDAELMVEVLEKHIPAERIRVIRDGAEALDFFHRMSRRSHAEPWDTLKLIIVDLKLPLADGLDVLHQTASNPHTKVTPTVVFTSSSEYRDICSSYRLGINSFVVKPVNADTFIERIRAVANYWLSVNQVPVD